MTKSDIDITVEILNEENLAQKVLKKYRVSKYQKSENKDDTLITKVIYTFFTRYNYRAAIIFTQDSKNRISMNTGIVDTDFNFIGKIPLFKNEVELIWELKNQIVKRFLREYPMYSRYLL